MKKAFEPVRPKNLTLKNRLVRSATWEGIAGPDGTLTEETYAIYIDFPACPACGVKYPFLVV